MSEYKQKGWIGFAPVYISSVTDDEPDVRARDWTPDWLLDISLAMYELCFMAASLMDPDFVPRWPIKITGKFDPPIQR